MSRENMVYEGKRTLACIVASLMYAIGVNLFVVPAQLYSGGLMGICQVIRTLLVEYLHMNFHSFDIAGIIYYIINVPIFIIAFTRMGRKFFAKTLVTVTAMTVFLSVVPIVQVVDDTVAYHPADGVLRRRPGRGGRAAHQVAAGLQRGKGVPDCESVPVHHLPFPVRH